MYSSNESNNNWGRAALLIFFYTKVPKDNSLTFMDMPALPDMPFRTCQDTFHIGYLLFAICFWFSLLPPGNKHQVVV